MDSSRRGYLALGSRVKHAEPWKDCLAFARRVPQWAMPEQAGHPQAPLRATLPRGRSAESGRGCRGRLASSLQAPHTRPIPMPRPPVLANADRARGRLASRPLQVVLVEPEIPPNTGNIARLCAATGSALHLVGPLGFEISEKAVRRAGLDYWHLVDLHRHSDLEAAERAIRAAAAPGADPRSWLFSGRGTRSYLEIEFRPGDALVFGKESVGLPDALLERRADQVLAIPMPGAVRSLNLSNAVAIVVYEALRQLGRL